MVTNQITNIFHKISGKEYQILNAEYKIPKTDMESTPIFEAMNFIDNNANVFIIYGENASGKSLITKILRNRLYDENITTRTVSMAERTTPGVKRAFLFGDDDTQSTGETSFTFLSKAFGGMINDEQGDKTVAIFDEPDLGLSSRYARALGKYFSEKEKELDNNKAIVIISHNEHFIKAFLKHTESNVSTLGINTKQSIDEWINDDVEYSIEQLEKLTKLGRSKHSGIERKLNEIKKEKNR